MAKVHWVIDYETMRNLTILCVEHFKKEEIKTFILHETQNDIVPLVEFLTENMHEQQWHISYNGLNFDSQITEFIIRSRNKLLKMEGDAIARLIYNKVQELIMNQENGGWPEFSERDLSIKQVDVYRLNHWDNHAKRASLKWIQYAMDWYNIQEMPIHHSQEVYSKEEIDMVVGYCINDVKSTKQILHLNKPQIELRKKIKQKYDLPCYSYSDAKIGSELLLKLYCEKTGKQFWDVRKFRTHRDEIIVDQIIFDYVEYISPEFKDFLNMLRTKVIRNTKGDFKFSHKFRGYKFDFGTGGIHQCIAPGVYESNEDFIIKDLDVASLYPSLAVVNDMYPAHLGKEFSQVYKNDIVDVRLKEKAKKENKDIAIIEGFKAASNCAYGNSNSQYSWLCDPLYTMQTTINGQLLITMLVENLLLELTDAVLLQTNTDGATLRVRRSELPIYEEICKKWEQKSKLTLEFADYEKMMIWDVNNYIAVYTSGKTKCKGRFEWEDLQNHKPSHLHKNKSFLIIPKAIYNYFVNGIPPEKYLADNRNIMDYCAGAKIKGDWEFNQTCIIDREVKYTTLQKVIRYYISNTGCKIIKVNKSDGREIQEVSGKWMQTVFNIRVDKEWNEYDVNDDFFLEKIYDEISTVIPKKSPQYKMDF